MASSYAFLHASCLIFKWTSYDIRTTKKKRKPHQFEAEIPGLALKAQFSFLLLGFPKHVWLPTWVSEFKLKIGSFILIKLSVCRVLLAATSPVWVWPGWSHLPLAAADRGRKLLLQLSSPEPWLSSGCATGPFLAPGTRNAISEGKRKGGKKYTTINRNKPTMWLSKRWCQKSSDRFWSSASSRDILISKVSLAYLRLECIPLCDPTRRCQRGRKDGDRAWCVIHCQSLWSLLDN